MLIGIDGNEANVERKVGISEFAFELISYFAQDQLSGIMYKVYLKSKPRVELPSERDNWQYRELRPGKLWTQWRLPLDLYFTKPRPDVFFTPSHYAPRFSPIPTVVSVMDLSYLHYPNLFDKDDLYQLKNWTKYSVENAKAVITISNSSRGDIIKWYKVQPEKVHVVYPGIKKVSSIKYSAVAKAIAHKQLLSMDELRDKFGIEGKYVLFVGTLQPRKNIGRLIEAFKQVLSIKFKVKGNENESLKLVIVGKKGWQYEEILAAPKKYGIEEHVKFLDFVSDEDLPSLYKNALCYVLPSLYEGFGLPVLEAMSYDCPVITSNVSSLPEAGGDAAVYIDPNNVDDIANKIIEVISNETFRKKMIEEGRAQVKKFSWEKAAKETLEILQDVADHK